MREEMERIGGQELLLPVVQPAELWRESGRYDAIGSELARFDDAGGRAMVLAMTHEESVTDLARSVIYVVSPVAAAGLPDTDQVPRRAAPAWRPDPPARVPDEGRLQLPRLPGRPRRHLRADRLPPTRPSSAGLGCRC